jgi:hypothetical protein
MPFDPAAHGQPYGLFIGLTLSLVVLVLRNRRSRKLRVELLWVRPVIFLALLTLSAAAAPPPLTPVSIALIAAAAAIGAALGWQRGRMMRIEVDPDTHALTSRASVLGIVFILGVLLFRMGLGSMLGSFEAQAPISPIIGADALLVLVVGMISVQGVEMWLRARRLLAEARAAKEARLRSNANSTIAT